VAPWRARVTSCQGRRPGPRPLASRPAFEVQGVLQRVRASKCYERVDRIIAGRCPDGALVLADLNSCSFNCCRRTAATNASHGGARLAELLEGQFEKPGNGIAVVAVGFGLGEQSPHCGNTHTAGSARPLVERLFEFRFFQSKTKASDADARTRRSRRARSSRPRVSIARRWPYSKG
jgi:hypothetical protein